MSAGLLNTVGVARIDDCWGKGRVAALCAMSSRMEMKSSANKKMTKVRGRAFEKVDNFIATSFQALRHPTGDVALPRLIRLQALLPSSTALSRAFSAPR